MPALRQLGTGGNLDAAAWHGHGAFYEIPNGLLHHKNA